MSEEDYIRDFCPKETESGCYDVKINDIPLYSFIRSWIRIEYLKQQGINHIVYQKRGSMFSRALSVLISFYHLFFLPKRVSYVFKTFRLENINGVWMDKFYDPIIEEIDLTDDYIILETNHGRLYSNRIHKKRVYFDDALALMAKIKCILLYPYYSRLKYKKEFSSLFSYISKLIPKDIVEKNKKKYSSEIISNLIRVNKYKRLITNRGVKCVLSASRSGFLSLLCACKKQDVLIYELQHGIGYGEDVTYGGKREKLFTPNKFLLFGDVYPRNVYGIDESDIVNIGWALKNYVDKKAPISSISETDVLILSQPSSTDYIVDSLMLLANNYPEITFYIRFHPMEKLTDELVSRLRNCNNIVIQDNNISLIVGLMPFKNVIGEQSTAVYEALSYGKKVGIIALEGKRPKFLLDSDEQCFWIIDDFASFESFYNGDVKDKQSGSIYSTFNSILFSQLIN